MLTVICTVDGAPMLRDGVTGDWYEICRFYLKHLACVSNADLGLVHILVIREQYGRQISVPMPPTLSLPVLILQRKFAFDLCHLSDLGD